MSEEQANLLISEKKYVTERLNLLLKVKVFGATSALDQPTRRQNLKFCNKGFKPQDIGTENLNIPTSCVYS
jgi:hypothetical protein